MLRVGREVTGGVDPPEVEGYQREGWKLKHVFAAALRKTHLPDFDRGYCADWMQADRIEFHALGGGWENCDDSYSREHGAAACGY
jgi:hypothetical protein